MNTFGRFKYSVAPLVIVIVTFLAACSGQDVKADAPAPTPSASSIPQLAPPSITAGEPGYDIKSHEGALDAWTISGSDEVAPQLVKLAPIYGFDHIYRPYGFFPEPDYMGIAKLEKYCVVAFSPIRANPKQGTMTLTIISRYNQGFAIGAFGVPRDEVKSQIDKFRPACRGEAPIPKVSDMPSVGKSA